MDISQTAPYTYIHINRILHMSQSATRLAGLRSLASSGKRKKTQTIVSMIFRYINYGIITMYITL